MEKTKTIVRRRRAAGELIALFPELPGDPQGRTCQAYTRGGQHSAVNYGEVIDQTEPLRWIAHEEQAFLEELAALGYDIELRFRQTEDMAKARRLSAEKRG